MSIETSVRNIVEIEIPVPWGHIRGKTWGDEKDKHVLVFHGILDNAGSFDRLIPLLPSSFYYICIDLPGHGFSSHFPPHLPIYSLSYIMVYTLIMEYFKQKRYIILGHSYGAQIGFLFAQLYPDYVEKLVMLDTVTLFPVTVGQFKEYLVDKFDTHRYIEEKRNVNEEPTYTYEEALNKLHVGRRHNASDMTLEAATALLHRNISPVENGRYRFTFDRRLKNFINPLRDFSYILETMKTNPVTCPVIMILGKGSPLQQEYMTPVLQLLRKWKNVTIKIVEGSHDVHNVHPENVAPLVSGFLLKGKGKL